MEFLYLILIFPLLWPWVAKMIFKVSITWQEMFLNIILVVVACTALWFFGKHTQLADVEIWNGAVASKERDTVSCSHSYSCRCRSDSKGNRSCDTCYEHIADYDWVVHSTAGDFTIDRINPSGSDEPPRWTSVQIGQPVALAKDFVNYIKASQSSIFHEQRAIDTQFKNMIPSYPSSVHDYHYVNRVIPVGLTLPDLDKWNLDLAMQLRTLGPQKQANVVIVVVNTNDPLYADALNRAWIGGKKNDVIVVIGSTAYPAIDWVQVLSWTDAQLFKVQLRDALFDQKKIDRIQVLNTISTHVSQSFQRKRMEDFAYLSNDIKPSTNMLILITATAFLGSILLTVVFHFYDVDLTRTSSIIRRRQLTNSRYPNRHKRNPYV